jgi:transcriptional regulator with XRE-family HTH domain
MNGEKKQSIRNAVIKDVREKLGISQQELAEQMGISRGRLSNVERGLETPDWLIKFAVLYRLLHESEMSWDDVVMSFPEPQKLREEAAEYSKTA